MICKACHAENPEDVDLCQVCNAPLTNETMDLDKTYLVTNLLGEYELGKDTWKWGQFLFQEDYLLILELKGTDNQVIVSPRKKIILGRSGTDEITGEETEGALVDFQQLGGLLAGVSRQHAQVTFNDHLVTVMDLNSTNGTRINGRRLDPHSPRLLREGDELQLGKLTLTAHFYKPKREKRS
ncbi:MAG: FHA domain-containing protein [Anaerolineae bacterium]|nr:FHA domain-containing protein [Anaerolineae bacterium]